MLARVSGQAFVPIPSGIGGSVGTDVGTWVFLITGTGVVTKESSCSVLLTTVTSTGEAVIVGGRGVFFGTKGVSLAQAVNKTASKIKYKARVNLKFMTALQSEDDENKETTGSDHIVPNFKSYSIDIDVDVDFFPVPPSSIWVLYLNNLNGNGL